MTLCRMVGLLGLACAALVARAQQPLQVTARIGLSGGAAVSHLHLDASAQRLYVARAGGISIIDTASQRMVAGVEGVAGARGIAIAQDLGRGFATTGRGNEVVVFDLATSAGVGRVALAGEPDAILFDRTRQQLLVFLGEAHSIAVLDARSGRVLATIAAGGEPEAAAWAADGTVRLNLEDTHEQVVFDPATARIVRRHDLRPCDRPTGMTIDPQQRALTVCRNQLLTVLGSDGQQLGTARIGRGADNVAWLDGLAYSADGTDGTITIVGPAPGGGLESRAVWRSAPGARRIVADAAAHRLYLCVPVPATGASEVWILEPQAR